MSYRTVTYRNVLYRDIARRHCYTCSATTPPAAHRLPKTPVPFVQVTHALSGEQPTYPISTTTKSSVPPTQYVATQHEFSKQSERTDAKYYVYPFFFLFLVFVVLADTKRSGREGQKQTNEPKQNQNHTHGTRNIRQQKTENLWK